MLTFPKWWSTFNKSGKLHPHYYLLGTEKVLIEEVVSLITDSYDVADLNVNKFVVGLSDDLEIWETLFSTPMDGGSSLTIVRGADKLTNMDLLPELVSSKSNTHLIIFVSDEKKIEKVLEENGDERSWVLPSQFENFEKKGRIIECNPFTQASSKTAVEWIKTKVESKDGALIHLLNESNGDMRLVRDVIQKLEWMEEEATLRNVSVMLKGNPSEDFVDALISLEKETALKSLVSVSENDYLQIIGQLDAQVDLAKRVHDLLMSRKEVPEIMKIIGPQAFLVPKISKIARHYSRDRCLSVRKVLAESDKRIRTGQKTGVMESLVVLW